MSGTRHPDHTPPRPSLGAWGSRESRFLPLTRKAAVMDWTTREVEIMRECGHLGAEAVREAILRECGVERTVRAIESQASRCHVSLRVRQVCPECGVVGIRLNRQSGLCARCTEIMHLNEEIAFNELLERERDEAEAMGDVAEIRRERDRMRQRNSRLCRKYGLASRRDRRGG